jgi:hypothetical protein
MKRQTIALILRPYKTVLFSRAALKQALDRFAGRIADFGLAFQNIHFSVCLPGYMLECIDPLLCAKLRELNKRGALEWLTTGYTEPFLSVLPRELCRENIRYGADAFAETVGSRPTGFFPACSNWENSVVDILRESSFHFCAINRSILPENMRPFWGFWITEQNSVAMPLIPYGSYDHTDAPESLTAWCEGMGGSEAEKEASPRLYCLDFRVALAGEAEEKSYQWLERTMRAMDQAVLTSQSVRIAEYLSEYPPLGLAYLPSSLSLDFVSGTTIAAFLNDLFTYDQVGVMQRRLLEASDNLLSRRESAHLHQLKKALFSAADINRLLPAATSGFQAVADRLYTFGKIIETEGALHEKDDIKSGQIRIADILKNGSKSIVMANNSCKVYIDHKNGGVVFALDYKNVPLNLCAAFDRKQHALPQIIVPGKSRTSFCDHILPTGTAWQDFRDGGAHELGDLLWGSYNYSVKKNPGGVRAVLRRRGSIRIEEKSYPLTIEKVFGLDKNESALSFVYHLENPTLSPYTFLLAIELNLLFPGLLSGQATLKAENSSGPLLLDKAQTLQDVRTVTIDDASIGCQFMISGPKGFNVWLYPLAGEGAPYQGTCCIINAGLTLEGNTPWKLMGTLSCKKNKKAETGMLDAI